MNINCRILVIDDNPINHKIVHYTIRHWRNTRMVFAGNGLEGLALLKEGCIDLVLMDLEMPLMDGLECTRAIRQGKAGFRNKDIPIIAFTSDCSLEAEKQSYQAGMDGYLVKPVAPEVLYREITGVLSPSNVLTSVTI